MKRTLILTIVYLLLCFYSKAQTTLDFNIDFDTPLQDTNISYFIDTVHSQNNIWQIGHSHKSYLNAGKVLITDTLNPYPVNDTSYFNIKIWNHGLSNLNGEYDHFMVTWYYRVDADSLKDFGFFEFSPDNGQTWYLMNDVIYQNCWWTIDGYWHPITGHTEGERGINLVDFGQFCIDNLPIIEDTIQLRFGFISDSNFDNKEGLMIDNIYISIATGVGVDEYQNSNHWVKVYPNPSDGDITIQYKLIGTDKCEFELYDVFGRKVYAHSLPSDATSFSLNGTFLPGGVYYYRVTQGQKSIGKGKVVVIK